MDNKDKQLITKEKNKNNMKSYDTRNKCGARRGCYVTILTKDSDIRNIECNDNNVYKVVFIGTHDILALLPFFNENIYMQLEEKKQVEEVFP